MQPNPAPHCPQTMGAVLIPLHGVCIPCHAQWRTMLRHCVGEWHLDKSIATGHCWACVLCTAVHGICIGGNESDEQCVKQWAAWVPRPPSRLGVATHQNPWARHLRLADSPSHIHPLCHATLSALCLGWAQLGVLFCPLLCSGGSDSCYRERLFTQRISPHTHNDPIGPACLANQLLRSATNRQGGEKELTVSLARHLHFTLHMHPQTALLHPKITELTQIQWCRLYFFSPPFYTYKASGQKIGQTLHGCGSTENGCFPHWNGGMQ